MLSRTTTQSRRGHGPRHQRWLAIPFALALLGGGLFAPSIAAAAGSGSISGTVTALAGGATLGGVCVDALGLSDNVISATTTDGNGNYQLANLSSESYALLFDPTCGSSVTSSYSIEFYNDAPDAAAAADVAVSGAVSGINETLSLGSTISGTVTAAAGGAPLAGVCVSVYDATGRDLVRDTTSAANGAYSATNLPVASYRVIFDPSCGETIASPYATQWWSNARTFDTATSVVLATPGSSSSAVNAALGVGASISGKVTAPGSAVASGVCVYVWDTSGNGDRMNATTTVAGGAYTVGSLPAGTYAVEFDPTCESGQVSDFSLSWYSGETSFLTATGVPLTTGGVASGINGSVALATAPVSVTGGPLAAATQGVSYTSNLAVSGGTGPYHWSASGLPSGLGINATTGAISGTPNVSGSFNVAVTVTDSSVPAVAATVSLPLTIAAPAAPVTTTTTVPPAPRATIAVGAGTLVVNGNALSTKVSCRTANCRGTLLLEKQVVTVVHHGKKTTKKTTTTIYARGSFHLAKSKAGTVKLVLTAPGVKALHSVKAHPQRLLLTATPTGGKKYTKTVSVT